MEHKDRVGAESATWGLGDALGGAAAGFLLSLLASLVVESVWPRGRVAGGVLVAMGSGEKLALTSASLVGLWVGLAGSAIWASRSKGTGSLARDFGLALRPGDVPLGIAVGVGCQLVLIPLLYQPFEAMDRHLAQQLSKPAHQLVGGMHGAELAVIGLFVSVGAPFVEELFFRGLLLRGLLKRLRPSMGEKWGVAGSVLVSALLFSLAHYEPLQLLGLAALGVVLAIMARVTGRLGPSIFAHAAFNAVTVIALAYQR